MRSNTRNAVFEKVIFAVEQTVYIERNDLTSSSRLVDDLRLGRFARLKLALYLEETFDVEITDEAVECFKTVGDIVRYMNRWCPENADLSGYRGASAPA